MHIANSDSWIIYLIMTSLNNNVLDAFKASGIPVASFIQGIVRLFREFEATHAGLIKEVLDNAGSIFSIFIASAQHAYSAQASESWATSFATQIIMVVMPYTCTHLNFFHIYFSHALPTFSPTRTMSGRLHNIFWARGSWRPK